MDQIRGAVADPAGKDYFAGKVYQISNRARHFEAGGFVGAVNPGDSSVDIFSGGNFVGTLFNSRGGANISFQYLTDLKPFDFVAGPGELVQAILKLNAGTNLLELSVDWSYVS
jgi:hypothetical protein